MRGVEESNNQLLLDVCTAMNTVKISIDRLIMNQPRHSLDECLIVLTWDEVKYLENVDRPDARVDEMGFWIGV
jgi:hypothetical protein